MIPLATSCCLGIRHLAAVLIQDADYRPWLE